MKGERLDFLADNPFYTKRFAYYVGRRCRAATIKDVAEELALDWHTVKVLDMQYMEAQLERAGTPGPQVIGVDEISIRKGHTYRIVVSDLARPADLVRRHGPFGGQHEPVLCLARREEELNAFALRSWTCGSRFVTGDQCACAASGDFVRQVPCHPPSGRGLGYGSQERVCGGSRADSDATSRARNTRCCRARRTSRSTASRALKTSVGGQQATQHGLCAQGELSASYGATNSEGWARKFFENWRASFKWQRLKPYEKFAAMIERHWDGIAAYCQPENKVSLGFVEGLNNKIRVIQRRAYGLARRRIPAAQSPHLHAAGVLIKKWAIFTHKKTRKAHLYYASRRASQALTLVERLCDTRLFVTSVCVVTGEGGESQIYSQRAREEWIESLAIYRRLSPSSGIVWR